MSFSLSESPIQSRQPVPCMTPYLRNHAASFFRKEAAPNQERWADQHHVDREFWTKTGAAERDLCLDAGAAGIVVSSHGGRQLDGVIPVPEALADVVGAVNGRCEVYVDGGVRSGRNVLRALAIGARAVLLGRPVLWGLAVGGSEGVREMLDEVVADFREALALSGCTGCLDVGPDIVQ